MGGLKFARRLHHVYNAVKMWSLMHTMCLKLHNNSNVYICDQYMTACTCLPFRLWHSHDEIFEVVTDQEGKYGCRVGFGWGPNPCEVVIKYPGIDPNQQLDATKLKGAISGVGDGPLGFEGICATITALIPWPRVGQLINTRERKTSCRKKMDLQKYKHYLLEDTHVRHVWEYYGVFALCEALTSAWLIRMSSRHWI